VLVAGLFAATVSGQCPKPATAHAFKFDEGQSAAGFRVRAGALPVRGEFARLAGLLRVANDGTRACVRAHIDAASVTMAADIGTDWARSADFFDADTFPEIRFRSQAFDPALLRRGGTIKGHLAMRGIERATRLSVSPARCPRSQAPVCSVRMRTEVRRRDFGMTASPNMVGDRVQLDLSFDVVLSETRGRRARAR